jgi:transposase
MKKHYVGIDLHGNNSVIGVLDEDQRQVFVQKTPNNLEVILAFLEPYKETIVGIVVESTFNWYWLVDGLMEHGYRVHLANPCAIQQYKGVKHTNDKHDAFFLAKLLLLNILPEGYIYPREDRQVRDLLRKRLMLVRNRTAHILSFKSLVNRNLGVSINSNTVKVLEEEKIDSMFGDEHLLLSAQANIGVMRYLGVRIKQLEQEILKVARLKPEFVKLLDVPGIGKVLGLTIALETGDIGRFDRVGNYASYCRNVSSNRLSNGKSKGQNNRKNGNKYLAWAYLEAAHKMKRNCAAAESFYRRKTSQTNKIVAIKALAHKISRACYYIMRDHVSFDVTRMFGKPLSPHKKDKGGGSKPARGLDKEPLAPIGQTAATTSK